jgi:hypothetical protein
MSDSYPIGKYELKPYSAKELEDRLIEIKVLPTILERAIINLDQAQLDTPYRDCGWTITEVVHHVADSHINAFVRFRLALTEDNPTIKPYNQDAWVQLADYKTVPINVSLTLLHGLHIRWHAMMVSVTKEMWERTIYHPEHKKSITLWDLLGDYAWHGAHHVAHITSLRTKKGW